MSANFITHRADVERNKKSVKVKNASWLGHSSGMLRTGDFFIFKIDGENNTRLARCHGQIRGSEGGPFRILAQQAGAMMAWTGEVWVDPAWVLETCPSENMRPEIVDFFDNTINFFK